MRTIKANNRHRWKAPERCTHVDVIGLKGAAALENSPWTEGDTGKPKDLWNTGSFQQLNIWWSALAKLSQGQCRESKLLLVRSRRAGWGTSSSAGSRTWAEHEWEVLLFGVQTFCSFLFCSDISFISFSNAGCMVNYIKNLNDSLNPSDILDLL